MAERGDCLAHRAPAGGKGVSKHVQIAIIVTHGEQYAIAPLGRLTRTGASSPSECETSTEHPYFIVSRLLSGSSAKVF